MKIIHDNYWDVYEKYEMAMITTNGSVHKNCGVMGAGIAKQALNRFPFIDTKLGRVINKVGNIPAHLMGNLYAFPVKHHWHEMADLKLIEQSCIQLVEIVNAHKVKSILIATPGCGNGGLDYSEVKPILTKYFDNRFTIIDNRLPLKILSSTYEENNNISRFK